VESHRVLRHWGSHIFQTFGSRMVVRLSALCTSRPLPPGRFLVLISVNRLSQPQGHSADGRIRSIEKSNDLFNVSNLNYIAPNDRMIVNNELQRVWNKAAVAQLTTPYWHLLLCTEESHENLKQDSQCMGWDLNPAPHEYKSNCYTLSQCAQIHGASLEPLTVPTRYACYSLTKSKWSHVWGHDTKASLIYRYKRDKITSRNSNHSHIAYSIQATFRELSVFLLC
jgi:hypothetical protein